MTGYFPTQCEHAFESALIDEARHRHGNELASALASLSLVKAGGVVDNPLLDQAIERLGYNVRIERLILSPGTPDLGDALLDLCSLLACTRIERPIFNVKLSGRPKLRELRMRLALQVAYEFLVNASKAAVPHAPPIKVRLSDRPGRIVLSVLNECREGERRGPGAGLAVLRRLARPYHGRIAARRDGSNFVAQFILPDQEGSRSQESRV
jgi:hypothetical protein